MRIRSLTLLMLFLGMSCIGGMCSKDGDKGDDNDDNDNYQEPVLKADATWSFLTSDDMLYSNNNRPVTRKWIATKQTTAIVVPIAGDPTSVYMSMHFENNDPKTRFLLDANNPGGKEVFDVSIRIFKVAPGTGTYTMDIDNKEGFCWYNVYKANGSLQDSTRHQSFTGSTLNITSMTPLPGGKSYLMSGTGTFEVIYFPTGASSSTDVHHFKLTFNNYVILYP